MLQRISHSQAGHRPSSLRAVGSDLSDISASYSSNTSSGLSPTLCQKGPQTKQGQGRRSDLVFCEMTCGNCGNTRLDARHRMAPPHYGPISPVPSGGISPWGGEATATRAPHPATAGRQASCRPPTRQCAAYAGAPVLPPPSGAGRPPSAVPKCHTATRCVGHSLIPSWREVKRRLDPLFPAGDAMHRDVTKPTRARHLVSSQPVPPVPHSQGYE
jgi:hypothetical protein